MKRAIAGIAALMLTGCVPSIPILVVEPKGDLSARTPLPAEVMNDALVTPRFGTGAIVVSSHERTLFADGCTLDVALDDQLVAGLRPGEQVTLFAEPGERVLSFSVRDAASCDPATTRVAVEVIEHTTQEIRLVSDAQEDLRVELKPYGRSLPP